MKAYIHRFTKKELQKLEKHDLLDKLKSKLLGTYQNRDIESLSVFVLVDKEGNIFTDNDCVAPVYIAEIDIKKECHENILSASKYTRSQMMELIALDRFRPFCEDVDLDYTYTGTLNESEIKAKDYSGIDHFSLCDFDSKESLERKFGRIEQNTFPLLNLLNTEAKQEKDTMLNTEVYDEELDTYLYGTEDYDDENEYDDEDLDF